MKKRTLHILTVTFGACHSSPYLAAGIDLAAIEVKLQKIKR